MLVRINYLKRIFVISFMINLVGCASFYDKTVDQPAEYHSPQQVDASYNIDGRFSIVNAEKNYYGNFTWEHSLDYDKLSLNSPLGNSVAVITVESGVAELQTSNGHYSGGNLDELLQQQLGFSLPLAYLHYWVQGIPLQNYPVENKLTSGFQQLGWKVEYLQWQDNNHPEILQLVNDNLRIKLLIANWN